MAKRLRIPVRARMGGVVFILLFLLVLATAHSGIIEMRDMSIEERVGEMTITLRFTEAVSYHSFTLEDPPRLVLDIPGVTLKEPRTIEVKNEVVETISHRQHGLDTLRVVVNLAQPAQSEVRKVGNELLLSLSLPREVRARLLTEDRARVRAEREEERRLEVERRAQEREEEELRRAEEKAKQLLEQGVKREIELKVRERERKLGTYLSQGERHYRANRFEEAIREFEAALALEPGNEEARNYLIMAREGKKTQLLAKERAAREEAERREEERRGQEERRREEERKARIAEHLRRGGEYLRQGRYAEAISQAEKVLALSPGNRPAEELIIRSRKQALRIAERRGQVEREIVERQRILDVSRAPFTSPVDYVGVKPRVRDREEVQVDLEKEREEAVVELRKKAEEAMVTMDFRDVDIREVLLYLSKLSRLTIAIDERALEELLDPNVTFFIPTPIPLTAALGIILRAKGLSYVIREHYIWVSSRERLEEPVTQIHRLQFPLRRLREIGVGRQDVDRREDDDRQDRRRRRGEGR